jgi:hypothetical protein
MTIPFARLVSLLAPVALTALLGTPAIAQTSTLPLAAPPVGPNAAASAIFDAMLAISRATLVNPAAAQAASFNYAAAIQRYNAGDLLNARQQALQAISVTAPLPPPQPAAWLAPSPAAGRIVPMPMILNPAQADAEAFLAVSRRALATCAVTGGTERAQIQQRYETAVREYGEQRYAGVRQDARSIIDACASALKTAP